jgi:hypothetical protein
MENSKLHFSRGPVEEVVTAINVDDAVFQLALPLVFRAGHLLKLRDDDIVALLVLLTVAAHIRQIVLLFRLTAFVLFWRIIRSILQAAYSLT